jgi:hypothetical protein
LTTAAARLRAAGATSDVNGGQQLISGSAGRPDADRNTTARSEKLKFFFTERTVVPLPQHQE